MPNLLATVRAAAAALAPGSAMALNIWSAPRRIFDYHIGTPVPQSEERLAQRPVTGVSGTARLSLPGDQRRLPMRAFRPG